VVEVLVLEEYYYNLDKMDCQDQKADSRTLFVRLQMMLHTADLGVLSVQGRTIALDTADYSS